MVDRIWTRHSTDIEQNTDVGLEDRAESIEEPAREETDRVRRWRMIDRVKQQWNLVRVDVTMP